MNSHQKQYEIRCPVYGFIPFNDWEREVINSPEFQRLRRIRQLAFTDLVYPGAMHTRFEHSIGVMHMASILFKGVVRNGKEILHSELSLNDAGIERHLQMVRLAALLHDIGHGPLSHSSENLLPVDVRRKRKHKHEDYSSAIVRDRLSSVIEHHALNSNYHITSEEIASLMEGKAAAGPALFWRQLISGQLDADRMDYLLRDAHHAGVDYGNYDWQRIASTITVLPGSNGRSARIGVEEGGWYAVESMILARYYMFAQVYFHKTRAAYDHHLEFALQELLPAGVFPGPEDDELAQYLEWDDWAVIGEIAKGGGGEHGNRIRSRDHYRLAYQTPDAPTRSDLDSLENCREALGDLCVAEKDASTSRYKVDDPDLDIPIISETAAGADRPLSAVSEIVGNLKPFNKVMLFVRGEDSEEAGRRIEKISNSGEVS